MFGYSIGMGEDMYGWLLTEALRERGSEQAKSWYIS